MEYLIGLDVGTTATKALLVGLDGQVVATATEPYSLITGPAGEVEQDPELIWQAVIAALKTLTERLDKKDHVAAICQSSQGGTTIPVSEDVVPLCNAISWMDQRNKNEKKYVGEQFGEEPLRAITGWPLINGLPLQHILWIKNNQPDIFKKAQYFLFVNDFIGYKLCGEFFMDPSNASITQLFNIKTKEWDAALLDLAGVNYDQFSPVSESGEVVGTISEEIARLTGLSNDTKVVNGAHDQYCTAVGLGVTEPGMAQLSCGTSWAFLAIPENLEIGLKSGLAISCHAVRDRWGGIHSLGGIGVCLEWVLDHLWEKEKELFGREKAFALINENVSAKSCPGSNGVFYFPVAGGHGEGYGLSTGGFWGLSIKSSRHDMARSVMEAVAFELRRAFEDFTKRDIRFDLLHVTGGGANSRVWQQIVADVTQTPVALPLTTQSASWGAIVLAASGVGLYLMENVVDSGKEKRHLVPSRTDLYEDVYLKYLHMRDVAFQI